jgi:AcrR family transcriptional regulator
MPGSAEQDPVAATSLARAKRSDARRNEQTLLDSAARVFAQWGVGAPVRLIATEAGVGMGTIYRHFPTRAELIAAVYRHQVDACVSLGETLLEDGSDPFTALREWIDAFVDFLATKHGVATVRTQDDSTSNLHDYFLDRLVPICDRLLTAGREKGEITAEITGYELMRAVGNLCLFAGGAEQYDARKLSQLLVTGTR